MATYLHFIYIYIFFFLIILFVYLFGLHWVFVAVVGLSSSCGVQEVLLAVVRGPLVDVTSLGQHGLYCSQHHKLSLAGSVVATSEVSSTNSIVMAHRLSCNLA